MHHVMRHVMRQGMKAHHAFCPRTGEVCEVEHGPGTAATAAKVLSPSMMLASASTVPSSVKLDPIPAFVLCSAFSNRVQTL